MATAGDLANWASFGGKTEEKGRAKVFIAPSGACVRALGCAGGGRGGQRRGGGGEEGGTQLAAAAASLNAAVAPRPPPPLPAGEKLRGWKEAAALMGASSRPGAASAGASAALACACLCSRSQT